MRKPQSHVASSGERISNHMKESVATVAITDIDIFNPPSAISGRVLQRQDRILLTAQTNTSEIGVYGYNGSDLIPAEDFRNFPGQFCSVIYGSFAGKMMTYDGTWKVISSGVDVLMNDGSRGVATTIIPGSGSTLLDGVLTIAGSGGGSGGGGTTSDYAVLIHNPTYNEEIDAAPYPVLVEAAPAPPNGTTAILRVDVRDLGSCQLVNGLGTITMPAQSPGSYSMIVRMPYGGSTSYSAETPFTVSNIQPVLTIVSPVNKQNVSIGTLDVELYIDHPTALPADFTVQVSFDRNFLTGVVSATYDPTGPHTSTAHTWRAQLSIATKDNYWVYVRVYDASPGRVPTTSNVKVCSLDTFIPLTYNAQVVNPIIELHHTTSVQWIVGSTVVSTSLSPTIDFGSPGTHIVNLVLGDFAELKTINNGFARGDDFGVEALPTDYDHPQQNLVTIGNPGRCDQLEIFTAARCPLGGVLNLAGMERMTWLELFRASLSSIILQGCIALRRFCAEGVDLNFLDLTDQANSLFDLRCAAMQGLSGTPMVIRLGVMSILYHWCVRSNVNLIVQNAAGTPVTGDAKFALFPRIREWWDFGDFQTGPFRPRSPDLQSCQIYYNNYDALDVEDQFPIGRNGEILAHHNPFGSVNIDGCPGIIKLDLSYCTLTSAQVDYVITTMSNFGTTGGFDANGIQSFIDLRGQAGPHQAAADLAAAMRLRRWLVYHEAVVITGVTTDNFNRADGAPGNGWTGVAGGAAGTILNNQLILTHSGYGVFTTNPTGLPASNIITATVTHATTVEGFFGLCMNWIDGNGLRVLWVSRGANPTVGDASGYNTNNVTVTASPGYPASWAVDQDHTIAVQRVGSAVTIFIDGVQAFTATCSINATRTGTSAGFLGEGGNVHVYDNFAITTP